MARSPGTPSSRRSSASPDDAPRPEDIEAFSDATRPCPKCKTQLYDDVAICWKCGYAVDAKEDAPGPPKWAIITVLVLLAVFLVPLLMRFW